MYINLCISKAFNGYYGNEQIMNNPDDKKESEKSEKITKRTENRVAERRKKRKGKKT